MSTNNNVIGVGCDDLFGFLLGKLADAEKSLQGREALANPPTISEEEWERLKSHTGTIIGKSRKTSNAKLEEEIKIHRRIAVKLRHEVEMFRAVIAAISEPNAEVKRGDATA